jgi:hypothetical protein
MMKNQKLKINCPARMKNSSSKAVDTILSERKRIKGIHGVVIDLLM